jgi:hypothetical protein
MICPTARRAWWPAVGPRLDRVVRQRQTGACKHEFLLSGFCSRPTTLSRFGATVGGMPLELANTRRKLEAPSGTRATTQHHWICSGEAPGPSRVEAWGFCLPRCLTFEVRRDQRRGARPARPMICPTASRAWCHAVGPRLDRRVRPQVADGRPLRCWSPHNFPLHGATSGGILSRISGVSRGTNSLSLGQLRPACQAEKRTVSPMATANISLTIVWQSF